ncbi:MAG: hypothetical protein E7108_08760 [Bacteroidales bacterium]|nr:hypothetical protein [Bacteroidales bacterium]
MHRYTSFLLITAALLSSCAPQRLSARQSLTESSHYQSDSMKDLALSVNSIRTQLLDLSSRLNLSDTSTLEVESERITEVLDTSSGGSSKVLSRTIEKSSARKKYGVFQTSDSKVTSSSSSADTTLVSESIQSKAAGSSNVETKVSTRKKTGLAWWQKDLIFIGASALACVLLRLAFIFFKPQLSGIATTIKNLLNKISI